MRKLSRHINYANVMATIAVTMVIGGGVAYAANTVFSTDIVDGEVKNPDLGTNSVRTGKILDGQVQTGDVANGNLNDEDVAQGTFVNFPATIGVVNANDCNLDTVSGIGAAGDHLILTPQFDDASDLEYTIEYQPGNEAARLVTCNYSDAAINDGTTHFNLLVIDAQ